MMGRWSITDLNVGDRRGSARSDRRARAAATGCGAARLTAPQTLSYSTPTVGREETQAFTGGDAKRPARHLAAGKDRRPLSGGSSAEGRWPGRLRRS